MFCVGAYFSPRRLMIAFASCSFNSLCLGIASLSLPFVVDAVIIAFTKHPPAIFLEEFYQVFLFHRLISCLYYTHLMRISQAFLKRK